MKHLVIIIAMTFSAAAFANDPAAHGSYGSHGTTTQADPTTPQMPSDKNAKEMRKHKGSHGKSHPKMNQPAASGTTTETPTHQ